MSLPMPPEEELQVKATLRPDEEILWQGRASAAPLQMQVKKTGGFIQRLRALCSTAVPRTAQTTQPGCVYLLTNKRVLQFQTGKSVQEWPLMLGMVQKVESCPDGSGCIIFDYIQPTGSSESQPCGILHVADVASVHAKLAAAIDAAYLASPWT